MKIAVLGGGVGGLSTAIFLKKAGFDVSVYERHNGPTEIGAGIVCWPNASFVLKQLDVLHKVEEVSGRLIQMDRFTYIGEPIGSLNINNLNTLMGFPSFSILRKDLMSILNQRCDELSINIHYQHNVETLMDAMGKTKVCFTHGDVIQPDVIIGADGRMNSVARKYVNGSNKPIYQGFINWIGVFESQDDIFSEISVSDYWGVGKRFGIVPVSKSKAYWAAGSRSTDISNKDPQLYYAELNYLFKEWPNMVATVINDTPLADINKIYVHDHNPIDKWYKHNVILLGDAAHSALPTSGQGACQALEDAWHLANCMTKNQDVSRAFEQFNDLRKAKTSGITIGGRQLASSIFSEDAAYCNQRDLASKNTDYDNVVRGMSKLWSSGLPIGG